MSSWILSQETQSFVHLTVASIPTCEKCNSWNIIPHYSSFLIWNDNTTIRQLIHDRVESKVAYSLRHHACDLAILDVLQSWKTEVSRPSLICGFANFVHPTLGYFGDIKYFIFVIYSVICIIQVCSWQCISDWHLCSTCGWGLDHNLVVWSAVSNSASSTDLQ